MPGGCRSGFRRPAGRPRRFTSSVFHLALVLSTLAYALAGVPAGLAQSYDGVVAVPFQALPEAPAAQSTAGIPSGRGAAVAPSIQSAGSPLRRLPLHLLQDQRAIWTSPLQVRPVDAEYLVPLGIATGLLLGSDQHTIHEGVHVNARDRSRSDNISNGVLASFGGVSAGLYGFSLLHDAPRARETGVLAGEAMLNSYAVVEALKAVSRRDGPLVDNARGSFGSSTWSNSTFPSAHSGMAWSAASVIAREYPGWLSQTAAYSAAAAVSLSRITAEKHFPSDVLVGGAAGWLIGRYVYRAHHNSFLDDYTGAQASDEQAHTAPDPIPQRERYRAEVDQDAVGSAFVPMDSWIYAALDRLAGLGFIPSQTEGLRPWTRKECARQVEEAEYYLESPRNPRGSATQQAELLLADLKRELDHDPERDAAAQEQIVLDSAYARAGTIAGPALADGYHFGQTWQNDYGRPLGQGSSGLAGFSLRARDGRLFFAVREELQHGPGSRPVSAAAQNQIAENDAIPYPNQQTVAAFNRQRPLNLYAGIAFGGNELTFGKQELYWGPLVSGPLSFSSNAEPTYNLQFVSSRPHPLPGFLSDYGAYRFDIVFGKLSGHRYPARPYFNGQKVSFNLGKNLEMGFTRWSLYGGVGHPLTVGNLLRNLFSFSSPQGTTGSNDPGDRKAGFDFRYRLPIYGRSITLYTDSYADDEPSPLSSPRRSAISPGIYFSRLPGLPHLDLRVESNSTLLYSNDADGQFLYWNITYHDSNLNKGFLLGNAVGRDARTIEARSTWWFSGRSNLQGGYRQTKGGTRFNPGGTTITDGFVNGNMALGQQWMAQIFTQYERFNLPVLGPARHNTSGWLQITWTPKAVLARHDRH